MPNKNHLKEITQQIVNEVAPDKKKQGTVLCSFLKGILDYLK